MTTIRAEVVLKSCSRASPELPITTMLLRYPRWIHAELLTHRLLSRNSASSRAIPTEKLIADIRADPAIPLFWGKNQKGMQADEECNEPLYIEGACHFDMIDNRFDPISREEAWLYAMERAIESAKAFAAAGYHKQIVNRIIEPFMHITVVVTATNWSNLLGVRDHKDAEPHFQRLAQEIRKAQDAAPINWLSPGEWHLPFLDAIERDKALHEAAEATHPADIPNALRLSVARCASTSYKTVEGFNMTMERAIALHDKLAASVPLHASPMEHQAKADYQIGKNVITWENPHLHGNLTGWTQYRKMLDNECL